MQVSDPKTLRKLLKRVDEIPRVKDFLTRLATSKGPLADGEPKMYLGFPIPTGLNEDFVKDVSAIAKKVKENQQMVALLTEIKELLAAHDFDGAQKVAKRILEVPQAVVTAKPRATP